MVILKSSLKEETFQKFSMSRRIFSSPNVRER
jgi:hypothetical protein